MPRPRRIIKVTLLTAAAAVAGFVLWVRSQTSPGKHEQDAEEKGKPMRDADDPVDSDHDSSDA